MKKRFVFLPLLFLCSVLSCSTTSFEGALKTTYRADEKVEEEDEEQIDDNKLVIKHMYFEKPGDCTLIQFGGKNILIDSGPKEINDSLGNPVSETFTQKLERMGVGSKDKLDYVIITHQDSDHTGNADELFKHPIGTLIDFDTCQDQTVDEEKRNVFETNFTDAATAYRTYRNSGNVDLYIPSSLCSYKKRGIDSDIVKEMLQKINKNSLSSSVIKNFIKNPDVFTIKNDDKELSLKILFNKYSIEPCKTKSVLVNCMSVCSLIEYDKEKYLFTGDLMEFKTSGVKDDDDSPKFSRVYGETDLIKNNYDDLKDGVLYYRGGHHGSDSSNSEYFLSVIRPQYVFWSSGGQFSGQPHYDFPTTNSLRKVGRYTDRIYVSSIDSRMLNEKNENGVSKLHGETTLTYDPDSSANKVNVEYENSNPSSATYEPDSIFLTSLFQKLDYRETVGKSGGQESSRNQFASREYPIYIYNLTTSTNRPDKPMDCSYIKFGHLDIIIGAGSSLRSEKKEEVINKIKYLCNDKVVDYLVIPTSKFDSYSFLLDNDGLFKQKDLSFKNVIYRDVDSGVFTKEFEDALSDLNANKLGVSSINGRKLLLDLCSNDSINKNNNLYLHFLRTRNDNVKRSADFSNWQQYSICTLFTASNFSYLNLGSDYSYGYDMDRDNPIESNYLLDNNSDLLLDKVDVLQMPYYGSLMKTDHVSLFYDFVSKISNNGENNNYTDSLGKFAVMANTTMYYKKDDDEKPVFVYPADLTLDKSTEDGKPVGKGLKYVKNGVEKSLLFFVSERTVDQSKTTPFAKGAINADLCLRATIQRCATLKREHYTKVTFGVNKNFSPYLGKLLFNNIFTDEESSDESTANITGNFSQENRNYGKIDDRYGFYDIRVKDEDFVVNN